MRKIGTLFLLVALLVLTQIKRPLSQTPVRSGFENGVTVLQTIAVSRRQDAKPEATISVRTGQHGIKLVFTGQGTRTNGGSLWIRDGFNPSIRVIPAWKFQESAVLILTFNRGAEDQILNVYDIRRSPVLLQHMEADGFDITEFSGEGDGNGDLRLFDGLPLAFRCFDWSAAAPGFVQHPCRSLPTGANTDAAK